MCDRLLVFFALIFVVGIANGQRVAVAHLSAGNITGVVLFTEVDEGVRVAGTISGMPPGSYGFHVHELGDIVPCDSTGAHFNPEGVNHGGPDHDERHVGDLGNIVFVSSGETGISTLNFVDGALALRGTNNILGRGLVLHEQEDDLGLGGHETSLTTGNAGARVACAVIGMHEPLDAWNSSNKVAPSAFLFLSCIALLFKAKV